jgi:hypothetical protein
MHSRKNAFKAVIILALLSLLFAQVAAQETRLLDVNFSPLKYESFETLTLTVTYQGAPVEGVEVIAAYGNEGVVFFTDKDGKTEIQLADGGTYFFELSKIGEDVNYFGEAKLAHRVEPTYYLKKAAQGEAIVCFVENLQSVIIQGEGKEPITTALDENQCFKYWPIKGEFMFATPDTEKFKGTIFKIELKQEPAPTPKPTAAPAKTPQNTPTPPKVVEQKNPDYTLPILAGAAGIVLIAAGLYLRRRRKMA